MVARLESPASPVDNADSAAPIFVFESGSKQSRSLPVSPRRDSTRLGHTKGKVRSFMRSISPPSPKRPRLHAPIKFPEPKAKTVAPAVFASSSPLKTDLELLAKRHFPFTLSTTVTNPSINFTSQEHKEPRELENPYHNRSAKVNVSATTHGPSGPGLTRVHSFPDSIVPRHQSPPGAPKVIITEKQDRNADLEPVLLPKQQKRAQYIQSLQKKYGLTPTEREDRPDAEASTSSSQPRTRDALPSGPSFNHLSHSLATSAQPSSRNSTSASEVSSVGPPPENCVNCGFGLGQTSFLKCHGCERRFHSGCKKDSKCSNGKWTCVRCLRREAKTSAKPCKNSANIASKPSAGHIPHTEPKITSRNTTQTPSLQHPLLPRPPSPARRSVSAEVLSRPKSPTSLRTRNLDQSAVNVQDLGLALPPSKIVEAAVVKPTGGAFASNPLLLQTTYLNEKPSRGFSPIRDTASEASMDMSEDEEVPGADLLVSFQPLRTVTRALDAGLEMTAPENSMAHEPAEVQDVGALHDVPDVHMKSPEDRPQLQSFEDGERSSPERGKVILSQIIRAPLLADPKVNGASTTEDPAASLDESTRPKPKIPSSFKIKKKSSFGSRPSSTTTPRTPKSGKPAATPVAWGREFVRAGCDNPFDEGKNRNEMLNHCEVIYATFNKCPWELVNWNLRPKRWANSLLKSLADLKTVVDRFDSADECAGDLQKFVDERRAKDSSIDLSKLKLTTGDVQAFVVVVSSKPTEMTASQQIIRNNLAADLYAQSPPASSANRADVERALQRLQEAKNIIELGHVVSRPAHSAATENGTLCSRTPSMVSGPPPDAAPSSISADPAPPPKSTAVSKRIDRPKAARKSASDRIKPAAPTGSIESASETGGHDATLGDSPSASLAISAIKALEPINDPVSAFDLWYNETLNRYGASESPAQSLRQLRLTLVGALEAHLIDEYHDHLAGAHVKDLVAPCEIAAKLVNFMEYGHSANPRIIQDDIIAHDFIGQNNPKNSELERVLATEQHVIRQCQAVLRYKAEWIREAVPWAVDDHRRKAMEAAAESQSSKSDAPEEAPNTGEMLADDPTYQSADEKLAGDLLTRLWLKGASESAIFLTTFRDAVRKHIKLKHQVLLCGKKDNWTIPYEAVVISIYVTLVPRYGSPIIDYSCRRKGEILELQFQQLRSARDKIVRRHRSYTERSAALLLAYEAWIHDAVDYAVNDFLGGMSRSTALDMVKTVLKLEAARQQKVAVIENAVSPVADEIAEPVKALGTEFAGEVRETVPSRSLLAYVEDVVDEEDESRGPHQSDGAYESDLDWLDAPLPLFESIATSKDSTEATVTAIGRSNSAVDETAELDQTEQSTADGPSTRDADIAVALANTSEAEPGSIDYAKAAVGKELVTQAVEIVGRAPTEDVSELSDAPSDLTELGTTPEPHGQAEQVKDAGGLRLKLRHAALENAAQSSSEKNKPGEAPLDARPSRGFIKFTYRELLLLALYEEPRRLHGLDAELPKLTSKQVHDFLLEKFPRYHDPENETQKRHLYDNVAAQCSTHTAKGIFKKERAILDNGREYTVYFAAPDSAAFKKLDMEAISAKWREHLANTFPGQEESIESELQPARKRPLDEVSERPVSKRARQDGSSELQTFSEDTATPEPCNIRRVSTGSTIKAARKNAGMLRPAAAGHSAQGAPRMFYSASRMGTTSRHESKTPVSDRKAHLLVHTQNSTPIVTRTPIKNMAISDALEQDERKADVRDTLDDLLVASVTPAVEDQELLDLLSANCAKEATQDRARAAERNFGVVDFFEHWPEHHPTEVLMLDAEKKMQEIRKRPNRRQLLSMPYRPSRKASKTLQPYDNMDPSLRQTNDSFDPMNSDAGLRTLSPSKYQTYESPRKRNRGLRGSDNNTIYAEDVDITAIEASGTQEQEVKSWQEALGLPGRLELGWMADSSSRSGERLVFETPAVERGRMRTWFKAILPGE